ncbi:hypothetical protein PAPYR_13310 [Paratrimastix pyriformis]|uniref:Uncharacterized protein n=1 Tax=Paratrimastix pyriformis TaxID=342808 RepID=A0ABQ8U5C1_9EUKA|nr:hypothetical protein PAPYR_13310 [Paratrimastix pyriformis]
MHQKQGRVSLEKAIAWIQSPDDRPGERCPFRMKEGEARPPPGWRRPPPQPQTPRPHTRLWPWTVDWSIDSPRGVVLAVFLNLNFEFDGALLLWVGSARFLGMLASAPFPLAFEFLNFAERLALEAGLALGAMRWTWLWGQAGHQALPPACRVGLGADGGAGEGEEEPFLPGRRSGRHTAESAPAALVEGLLLLGPKAAAG